MWTFDSDGFCWERSATEVKFSTWGSSRPSTLNQNRGHVAVADCGELKSHCAVEGPVFPRVVRKRDFRLRELVPTPLNLRSLRRASAVSAFRFRWLSRRSFTNASALQ